MVGDARPQCFDGMPPRPDAMVPRLDALPPRPRTPRLLPRLLPACSDPLGRFVVPFGLPTFPRSLVNVGVPSCGVLGGVQGADTF